MATDGRDSTWYERRAKAIRILASEAFCSYTRERLEQMASGWESCAMSMRLAERDELWLAPDIVATEPALIAQHCAEAGLNEKAVRYRLTAGHQALGRSAMTEAVAQLTKGLEALAKLPEGIA